MSGVSSMNDRVPLEIEQLLALRPLSFQGLNELLQELDAEILCHAAWKTRTFVDCLHEAELAHLVRAYVLLEELAPRAFCGGSTTQVPQLLAALKTFNAELSQELTVWAFHTSTNPYVPFGTSNSSRGAAHTVDEYQRLESERAARRSNLKDKAQAEAKERRAMRESAHRRRVVGHEIENEKRNRHINELLRMPAVDRLMQICAMQDHPPGYFPIEVIELSVVEQLSPEQRDALLVWLRRAPRGPWRRLRSAITAALEADAVARKGS